MTIESRTIPGLAAPQGAPHEVQSSAGSAPVGAEECINILLVDDEPKNLTVLESILDDPRYRLVSAESAEKGLLALVVEEFALIILDIHMPGMNGFEMAQMVKHRKKTAEVPIIFLTAYYSEDQHVLEGYFTGAVDYLHKPINPTILRSKVAVFADLYRKTRALSLSNRTLLSEISERRRAQEELRHITGELEQRVVDRTADLVEANAAVIESEERLKLAQSAGGVGVWDWNIAKGVTYWSETMWAMYGVKPVPEQDVQACWRNALHPDDRQRIVDQVAGFMSSSDSQFRFEFRICLPEGGIRWIETIGRVHRDADGRPIRLAGVNVDLTERRRVADQLRLSEERFQLAMRNSRIVVYTTDRELRYTWTSDPHQILVPPQALGRTDTDLFPPERAARLTALKMRVLESGVGEHATFSVNVDETDYEYDLTVEPLADAGGDRIGVAVAAMEITELKRAEATLKEADRRKDDFLAVLGHELRNPLAGIASAIEVLQSPNAEEEDRRKMLPILERQTRHMRRLTDDLLEISRISRGKLHMQTQPLNLVEVVRGACTDIERKLHAAGLTLDLKLPDSTVWINGDATRLAQVIANLLDNATKFTGSGGTITVDLHTESRGAVLIVRDTGAGIPPQLVARIFEPFNQAGIDAGSRGGLGLGLALAKGLLALIGGNINAASAGEGKGAEFTVRLPVIAPPAGSAATAPAPAEKRERYRIVIIDDSHDAAYPLKVLLSHLGHEVSIETDGAAGVEAVRVVHPDLVLCDIGMPGTMDGYHVARELRCGPTTSGTYLVAVTGYGQDEDRRRAREAGFDQHLTKPVGLDTLRAVLCNMEAARANRGI